MVVGLPVGYDNKKKVSMPVHCVVNFWGEMLMLTIGLCMLEIACACVKKNVRNCKSFNGEKFGEKKNRTNTKSKTEMHPRNMN